MYRGCISHHHKKTMPIEERKRDKVKAINPMVGQIILVINIIIIIGMFLYARQHLKTFKIITSTFDQVEYLFQVTLLSNKIDYLLKLEMKNKEKKPKLLKFSKPQYEFIIKKFKRTIWQVSGINQEEVLLLPEGRLCFSQIWDQRNTLGEMVEPGEYQVVAKINLSPPRSLATQIKVRE
ncbi:hypothetical protein KKB84_02825 [bacterium]|nr:hypothetical protein [bacterium]